MLSDTAMASAAVFSASAAENQSLSVYAKTGNKKGHIVGGHWAQRPRLQAM
jgi:hypothetical protein